MEKGIKKKWDQMNVNGWDVECTTAIEEAKGGYFLLNLGAWR